MAKNKQNPLLARYEAKLEACQEIMCLTRTEAEEYMAYLGAQVL